MNNDPFAKLGAIDQKLFQKPPEKQPAQPDATIQDKKPANPQGHLPESPQTGKPVSGLAEKPASVQARKPATEKPEKYTTRLEPSMIRKLKVFAAQQDMNDYDVVKIALLEYFEKHT